MMNANRLTSGKSLYGQALLVGSTRTFSSFRPIQLPGGCRKQTEIILYNPECTFSGLKPSYLLTNTNTSPNKRIKKELSSEEDINDSDIMRELNSSCKSIEKLEDLCIAEVQSKKNQHCRKKRNSMKKKCRKKRGNGGCGTKKPVPEEVIVCTRQISECDSEDAFVIEFQCPDADDAKDQSKKVRFADDEHLCQVHIMNRWDYAYRAARKGPWEEMARDRDRFTKRIKEAELQLSAALDPHHRQKIYNERFQCK